MKFSKQSLKFKLLNPFPILIKPTLIRKYKSRALKIPHEHLKRRCTNFERRQTIMNAGGLKSLGGYNRKSKGSRDP